MSSRAHNNDSTSLFHIRNLAVFRLCFLFAFKSCGSRRWFLFRHSTLQTSKFCFFSFQIPWHTVELIFSALDFGIHQNLLLFFRFFLIFTTDLEKAASYFSTSNPAFSQAYVLRIRPLFSPAETSFTALSFRFF